jgi:hypothetical protein
MVTVTKKEIVPHLVFVDTSILWHEDKSHIVDPAFDDFWDEYSRDFKMELVVPEVVKGEILFQHSTSAIKSMERATECIKKVCKITKKTYSHRITETGIKKGVAKRFEAWLSSKGGVIAPTPFSKIDWKDMVERAIWRKPPFPYDPRKTEIEKGFRDAVIAETVVYTAGKDSRKIRRIFLCKDELLGDTGVAKLKWLETYESIDDFRSYLKLTKEKLEDKFITSILKKASLKFWSKLDPKCLYNRENIWDQMGKLYPDSFEIPAVFKTSPGQTGEDNWKPLDSGRIWLGKAEFEELVSPNEYHWINKITYVRQFRYEPTTISFPPDNALAGHLIEVSSLKAILVSVFKVKWKSKVTTDGRFRNLSLLEIKHEDTSFREPTEAERKAWDLQE